MTRNLGSPDMECIKSDRNAGTCRRRNPGQTSIAKESGFNRTNPRSKSVNPSSRANEFAAFAEELRRDLDPRGPLESLMADHVVQSAWRLKGTLDRQKSREKSNPEAGTSKEKSSPTADRAAKSVRDALESLDYLRGRRPRIALAPEPVEFEPEFESNEWPIVPSVDFPEDPIADEPREDETPNWRDRLVFDFEVSDISPVVKGTWITVGHVVSLIVDGWTWADILRSHPELTEDDIRTCVAYAMAEEGEAN